MRIPSSTPKKTVNIDLLFSTTPFSLMAVPFCHIFSQVLAEEHSNSSNTSVIPEARHVDTSERPSLNSDFEKGVIDVPESTANISAEVSSDAPTEIDPQINMSRKSKRKSKIQCRTKHVFCNEGADNLQV